MQTNDAIYKALTDAGFNGLYDWLLTFKAGPSSNINDLWRDALLELTGLPANKYNWNDYYSAYLTGRGYSGSLVDQQNQFWNDVATGVIPLPGGGTPPVEVGLTVGFQDVSQGALEAFYKGFSVGGEGLQPFGDLQPRVYEGIDLDVVMITKAGSPALYQYNSLMAVEGGIQDYGDITTTINGIEYTWVFVGGESQIDNAYVLQNEADAMFLFEELNIDQTYSFDLSAANPPVEQGIVLESQDLGEGTISAIFSDGQAGVFGSLEPRNFFDTGIDITTISFTFSEFSNLSLGVIAALPTPLPERPNFYFNLDGMQIEFGFNSGTYLGLVTKEQVQAIYAKVGQLLPFSFEEIAPTFSQITIATGTYSNGQPVAGYGVGVLQGGGDLGSISPPLLLDGQIVTELAIRNNNGISYPNIVTAAGATDIGDLYLNIGTDTFTLVWIGFRYAIPGGSGGQQQQQFYDFLVANDGVTLPISITDTAPLTNTVTFISARGNNLWFTESGYPGSDGQEGELTNRQLPPFAEDIGQIRISKLSTRTLITIDASGNSSMENVGNVTVTIAGTEMRVYRDPNQANKKNYTGELFDSGALYDQLLADVANTQTIEAAISGPKTIRVASNDFGGGTIGYGWDSGEFADYGELLTDDVLLQDANAYILNMFVRNNGTDQGIFEMALAASDNADAITPDALNLTFNGIVFPLIKSSGKYRISPSYSGVSILDTFIAADGQDILYEIAEDGTVRDGDDCRP